MNRSQAAAQLSRGNSPHAKPNGLWPKGFCAPWEARPGLPLLAGKGNAWTRPSRYFLRRGLTSRSQAAAQLSRGNPPHAKPNGLWPKGFCKLRLAFCIANES